MDDLIVYDSLRNPYSAVLVDDEIELVEQLDYIGTIVVLPLFPFEVKGYCRDKFFRFKNGKKHSIRYPATVDSMGAKWWYMNGKLHRVDGPAVEHADGSSSYYINDIFCKDSREYITKREEWLWLCKNS